MLDKFEFFRIELVPESAGAEIEGTTGFLAGKAAFGAIVKTPAGGASGNCTAEVGGEIGGAGLPIGVTAAEWFLIVKGSDAAKFAHHVEASA